MVQVELLTIGNELLDGRITNTNASFLSQKLSQAGFWVRQTTCVADNIPEIVRALQEAWSRANIILLTGGLGPTHCDLTTEGVAAFLGVGLEFHESAYQAIVERFQKRGIVMTENNKKQAYIPQGTELLYNNYGTASGFALYRDRHYVSAMPGVPYEMKPMFSEQVLPRIMKLFEFEDCVFYKWCTTGIAESHILEKLHHFAWLPKGVWVSPLPSYYGVNIQAKFPYSVSSQDRQNTIALITSTLQEYTYGHGDDELETVVGKLLSEQKKTLAIAESCTGGLIMHRMTNISGCSQYFLGGEVVYNNVAKIQMGVAHATIERFGAVSAECASEMAYAIRKKYGSRIGIATTGIAGPTGETPLKPLGLVYIAYDDGNVSDVARHIFKDERQIHKHRSSQAALALLWKHIRMASLAFLLCFISTWLIAQTNQEIISGLLPEVRQEIIVALQSNIPENQIRVFPQALQSTDSSLHEFCIQIWETTSQTWRNTMTSKLIEEYDGLSIALRIRMLQGLGTYKIITTDSQKLILKVLQYAKNEGEKLEALSTLACWYDKAAFAHETLVSIYPDSNTNLKIQILQTFACFPPTYTQLANILKTALIHESVDIRWQAVFLMGLVGPKNDASVTALLFPCVQDTDVDVVVRTVESLAKITGPNDIKAIELLALLRNHEEVIVRIHACSAMLRLSKGKYPEGLRILYKELEHPKTHIRLLASAAIIPFDPRAWQVFLHNASILPRVAIPLLADLGLAYEPALEFLQTQYHKNPSEKHNILTALWMIYRNTDLPKSEYFQRLLANESDVFYKNYLQDMLRHIR